MFEHVGWGPQCHNVTWNNRWENTENTEAIFRDGRAGERREGESSSSRKWVKSVRVLEYANNEFASVCNVQRLFFNILKNIKTLLWMQWEPKLGQAAIFIFTSYSSATLPSDAISITNITQRIIYFIFISISDDGYWMNVSMQFWITLWNVNMRWWCWSSAVQKSSPGEVFSIGISPNIYFSIENRSEVIIIEWISQYCSQRHFCCSNWFLGIYFSNTLMMEEQCCTRK